MKRPLLVGLAALALAAIVWIAVGPNSPDGPDRRLQPASFGPRSGIDPAPDASPADRLHPDARYAHVGDPGQLQPTPAPSPTPVDCDSRPSADSRPASTPAAPPRHDYLPDRVPDEIRADGTHVYHNYPFQMKQPDGSFATVPVTVCFTPVPAAPVLPPEAESAPPR